MEEETLKDEIEEALADAGYCLGNFAYAGKDGVKKLVDKVVNHAMKTPFVDIENYADSLVSEPRYKIIWDCPDPTIPISNWFYDWLPENCVSACFYAGDEEIYSLMESDYPTWSDLPYAPYYTYHVPFTLSADIQNEIRIQAQADLEDNTFDDAEEVEDYEPDAFCERCIVMVYQTLK